MICLHGESFALVTSGMFDKLGSMRVRVHVQTGCAVVRDECKEICLSVCGSCLWTEVGEEMW